VCVLLCLVFIIYSNSPIVVLMGSCFEKLWLCRRSIDMLDCIDKFGYLEDLMVQVEEKKHQEQEYVVPGQSSGNWLQC